MNKFFFSNNSEFLLFSATNICWKYWFVVPFIWLFIIKFIEKIFVLWYSQYLFRTKFCKRIFSQKARNCYWIVFSFHIPRSTITESVYARKRSVFLRIRPCLFDLSSHTIQASSISGEEWERNDRKSKKRSIWLDVVMSVFNLLVLSLLFYLHNIDIHSSLIVLFFFFPSYQCFSRLRVERKA